MKLLLTILLFISFSASATNYFVKEGGGTGAGTSDAAAWSLAKYNTMTFSAGDSIFVKRGSRLYGQFNVPSSGNSSFRIYIGAYGTGNKPVITGLTDLTSWTSLGSNKWSATLNSGSRLSLVVIDSTIIAPGRFPNADAAAGGYLTVDSRSPSSGYVEGATITMTDAALTAPASGTWAGGEIAVRNNYYTFDRAIIATNSGTTLTFPAVSQQPLTVGFGYFIQNHPQTLDQQNEWYYNSATTTFTIYSTTTPGTVSASTVQTLLDVSGRQYLTIEDLKFVGADTAGLYIGGGANHIDFRRCDFQFNGTEGLTTHESDNANDITFDGGSIIQTNSYAVQVVGMTRFYFTNNVVKYAGLRPGLGRLGSAGYGGVGVNGNDNIIQYNEIDSVGGLSIGCSGNNIWIDKNYINYYAHIYDDVGGIYLHNSGTTTGNRVTYNFVFNGYGGFLGTDLTVPNKASALYDDEGESNTLWEGNIAINSNGNGLYLHEVSNNVVRGNVLINHKIAQINIRNDDNSSGVSRGTGHQFKSNILYSEDVSVPLISIYNDDDNTNVPAILTASDSNVFMRPFNPAGYIYVDTPGVRQFYNAVGFNGDYGYEAHGSTGPVIPQYGGVTAGSNTFSNSSFTSAITGVTASNGSSSDGNTTVSLDAKLDGNAVKTASSSGVTTDLNTLVTLGAMTSGHTYMIKFSAIGSYNKANIRVLFMEGIYNGYFGTTYFIPLSTIRTENTVYVTANAAKTNARMVLELRSPGMPYWIDNVTVQDMTAFTSTVLSDSVRVEYNNSKTLTRKTLPYYYRDVKNITYLGGIDLLPYTSSILQMTGPLPAVVLQTQRFKGAINIR